MRFFGFLVLALFVAISAAAQEQIIVPQLGQQAMADSASVAIASDQSAIPISASSLPLPSGASTAAHQVTLQGYVDDVETKLDSLIAGQLADSHNVTIDNGAGVAAVNIQDGGNSITIDGSVSVSSVGGTVAVTQSGTWDEVGINDSGNSITVDGTVTVTDGAGALNVIVDSSALPTGAATAANQLPDGHNVTIDNASGASAVNIQDGGNSITVDDGSGSLTIDNAALSVTGGGTEASALRVTIANNSTGVLSVDDNGSSLTVDGTVAATQSGAWSITNISGTVSLPTGAATAANQSTIIGHVDGIETKLDSLIGNGKTASSATEATGGVTTSSAQILASNANRKAGFIQNVSDTTVWISFGGTAVEAAPSTKLVPTGVLDLTTGGVIYTGAINAIHGGTGTKNVTITTF